MGICLAKCLTHNISTTMRDRVMVSEGPLHIRSSMVTWLMRSSDDDVTWPQKVKIATPISLKLNISKIVREMRLVKTDYQWETAYQESNGHVTDDVTCRKWWQLKAADRESAKKTSKRSQWKMSIKQMQRYKQQIPTGAAFGSHNFGPPFFKLKIYPFQNQIRNTNAVIYDVCTLHCHTFHFFVTGKVVQPFTRTRQNTTRKHFLIWLHKITSSSQEFQIEQATFEPCGCCCCCCSSWYLRMSISSFCCVSRSFIAARCSLIMLSCPS